MNKRRNVWAQMMNARKIKLLNVKDHIVPSQTPDIFTNPNLHEHLLFTQPAFKGHFLSLHSTENKNIIKLKK